MKDPSADDCYPVGKQITITLPDPEPHKGNDKEVCSNTDGKCDNPTRNIEDHALSIQKTTWKVTNSEGTVAEGESSTATFTPTKPSKSKNDYTITFTVKPECQAPHCESCDLKDKTASATFTVVGVKSILVADSDGRSVSSDDGKALEVVPPKGGENVSGEAKLQPDLENPPPKWPEWACNGQNQYGKEVMFAKGAAGWSSDKTLLYNVVPQEASVLCEGEKVGLKCYPYSIGNVHNYLNSDIPRFLIA
jgi:hypothetical protein